MKKFTALPVLALLCACTSDRPAAELAFVDVAPLNGNFQVTFQSNVQFFEMFSKNRRQRPEASKVHVLLEMTCQVFEYRPNRFSGGVTYYLYDQPTGMMREIWRAGVSGKDDRLPFAEPRPLLTRLDNGYQFDWTGAYPGSAPGEIYDLHNRFTRKQEGQESILDCTNVAPGATLDPEDQSTCEGAYLQRVGG